MGAFNNAYEQTQINVTEFNRDQREQELIDKINKLRDKIFNKNKGDTS